MTKEEKQKAIDALKMSVPIVGITPGEFTDYIQTLNKIMDWLEQDPCSDAINKQELIGYIDKTIKATNMDDTYSCGMRNGMRLIKSFITNEKQEFEKCCYDESEPDTVSFKVDGDVVVKYEYMFGSEEDDPECKTKIVMTKEIFQKCYEKWIKPQIRIVCDCCPREVKE